LGLKGRKVTRDWYIQKLYDLCYSKILFSGDQTEENKMDGAYSIIGREDMDQEVW
jgi:predicted nucleic acid-binding protein